MTRANNPHSERVLILAPQGRDAGIAQSLLNDANIPTVVMKSLSELVQHLKEMAGAVLITEEALHTADVQSVSAWLARQPAWSDMPFIVLTRQGGGLERNPGAARLSQLLGNVTFLERPFHPTTLISLTRTALRGRRRQYEARGRLEELRANEEQLRELNATLEQRVAQEVDERLITEEALRQSQKMEAVGQLTGGVAHDFNNLLTIIRSSVDLLRRPNLSDERRGIYTDAVSDTVDRAAKLTGQLLAFARRQALKPEVFDVGFRLHAIADMLNTVAGSHIRLLVEIDLKSCFVQADPSQFDTAVVNMGVNARDAMNGAGMLTLRLDAGQALPPIRGHAGAAGPFVVVSLTDTGSGIAPDQIGKIFEPFFTTKAVGKGTGLGLSQVFGFAKQSGGDVEVESVMGQGTTFRLYLPQVDGHEAERPHDDTDDAATDGEGRRVLVVEDNVQVGTFAAQILQDLGYEIVLVGNAEEALRELERDRAAFDIVFSDVVMPGMGGVELAKILKKRFPRLPVVLASGYSHVLAEEGAHGFELLHKPYSADQLSRVLRRMSAPPEARSSLPE